MNTPQALKYVNNILTVALIAIGVFQNSIDSLKVLLPNMDTVHWLAIAGAVRAIIALVGDAMDDGILNGSFKVMAVILALSGVLLVGGCSTACLNDTIRTANAGLAIYASARTGQPIVLPEPTGLKK